jgi:hypothetical protein
MVLMTKRYIYNAGPNAGLGMFQLRKDRLKMNQVGLIRLLMMLPAQMTLPAHMMLPAQMTLPEHMMLPAQMTLPEHMMLPAQMTLPAHVR